MKEIIRTLIYSFCILIEITLIISIYLNGIKLDCSKCKIHLTSNKLETTMNDFYINITVLYDSYINNECVIKYDNTQGYLYDFRKTE